MKFQVISHPFSSSQIMDNVFRYNSDALGRQKYISEDILFSGSFRDTSESLVIPSGEFLQSCIEEYLPEHIREAVFFLQGKRKQAGKPVIWQDVEPQTLPEAVL